MSLYCAASVYIYLSKENQARSHITNLEFITSAMEAIGRNHVITRAFLRQVLLDMEHNDVRYAEGIPRLDRLAEELGAQMSNNIPLLARSRVSRHTGVQPPLPGRLPLGKPVGKIIGTGERQNFLGEWSFPGMRSSTFSGPTETATSNKRRRTSHSTTEGYNVTTSGNSELLWGTTIQDPILLTTPPSLSSASMMINPNQAEQSARAPPPTTNPPMAGESATQMNLPHRIGSPAGTGDPDANVPGEPPSQQQQQQQQQENTNSTSNEYGNTKKLGVSINSSIIERFGPRPFTTRGREAGASVSARRGNLGSWDYVSRCMFTQFLHGKTADAEMAGGDDNTGGGGSGGSGGGDGGGMGDGNNLWSNNMGSDPDAEAQVDWSLFATTGASVDVGCLGYGSVSGMGMGSGSGSGGVGEGGGGGGGGGTR